MPMVYMAMLITKKPVKIFRQLVIRLDQMIFLLKDIGDNLGLIIRILFTRKINLIDHVNKEK